jgi:hypothetical protein
LRHWHTDFPLQANILLTTDAIDILPLPLLHTDFG